MVHIVAFNMEKIVFDDAVVSFDFSLHFDSAVVVLGTVFVTFILLLGVFIPILFSLKVCNVTLA